MSGKIRDGVSEKLRAETVEELRRIGGGLQATNGKRRSLDDIIRTLIDFYKKHKEAS